MSSSITNSNLTNQLEVLLTRFIKGGFCRIFSPRERLPSSGELNGQLVLAILIAPLGEEISFRGLFQERLGWFMPTWVAIGVTSLLFALMHLSYGPADVVFWDLFSVFVDSLFFGIIYAKTKNILVSYIAHLLADVIGMLLILVFM
jgi:membrane protease YdiL (CAAX protease family)